MLGKYLISQQQWNITGRGWWKRSLTHISFSLQRETCLDMLWHASTCLNMLWHASTCLNMLWHASTCLNMLRQWRHRKSGEKGKQEETRGDKGGEAMSLRDRAEVTEVVFFRRRQSMDGGRRTAVGGLQSLSLHFSLFSIFFSLSLFTTRNVSPSYSPIVLRVRNVRKIPYLCIFFTKGLTCISWIQI